MGEFLNAKIGFDNSPHLAVYQSSKPISDAAVAILQGGTPDCPAEKTRSQDSLSISHFSARK
jgi:hypothetical protein